MKNDGCALSVGIFYLFLFGYSIITWIINMFNFLGCDFQEPWSEEIIYLLGLFIIPLNWFTVWLNFG